MQRLAGVFFHWLPLGAALAGLCGIFYLTTESLLRTAQNDPQVQIADDSARSLAAGASPAELVPRYQIDIRESLAPFLAIYDASGTALESSGILGGAPPKLPAGLFEHTRLSGESRLTWQPDAATRIALVVRLVPDTRNWFVAAGRNMREGEARAAALAKTTLFAFGALLIVTFLLELLGERLRRRAMARGSA